MHGRYWQAACFELRTYKSKWFSATSRFIWRLSRSVSAWDIYIKRLTSKRYAKPIHDPDTSQLHTRSGRDLYKRKLSDFVVGELRVALAEEYCCHRLPSHSQDFSLSFVSTGSFCTAAGAHPFKRRQSWKTNLPTQFPRHAMVVGP
jgi:hypothetical protein